jgi:hypothetical protein
MSPLVRVTVEPDHLERFARPSRSLNGIAELIWNGLDAEATLVEVAVSENELGGVDSVMVSDNGHGMTYEEATHDFSLLGGSWKLEAGRSKGGERILHGKYGQGRWRAFSVGNRVQWQTVAQADGARRKTTITSSSQSLTEFDIAGPDPTEEPTGTKVQIRNIHPEQATALSEKDAGDRLTTVFAPYLEQYAVTIRFRGRDLDPSSLQKRREEYELQIPVEEHGAAQLTVIEWNKSFPRELLLCDSNGIALQAERAGIHAPEFDFTAYLKWQGFREFENELPTVDLHPIAGPVIEIGREQLRRHFRQRGEELRTEVIREWKKEEVYPYRSDVSSELERVERDLFDLVAVTAAGAVNSGDRVSRRLSLTLLKQALERSPSALRRVLEEVLELAPERLADLNDLLSRTSLTSLISMGQIVTDRLDFLEGLSELVFDPEARKVVLERSQLHRILAREIWIFGDEYNLAIDDEGLRSVLKQHIRILGREVTSEDVEPARLEDGSQAIVDLMLSATIPLPQQQHEHLVVELKRPSIRLGAAELSQITQYADAVAQDPRFLNMNVTWNFWLVGTEMDGYVQGQANQAHRPPGMVSTPHGGRVTVWAKTWSQIIDDCRQRLKFVQNNLAYRSSREAGVEYLRRQHERFLPDLLKYEEQRV